MQRTASVLGPDGCRTLQEDRARIEPHIHEHDGYARFGVTRKDGFAFFSITDTGTGIAPEIAEKLFQPFVTSKANGMGVGLSICRTIIEAHGGRIAARANEGGGTAFEFTLPFAEAEASGGKS